MDYLAAYIFAIVVFLLSSFMYVHICEESIKKKVVFLFIYGMSGFVLSELFFLLKQIKQFTPMFLGAVFGIATAELFLLFKEIIQNTRQQSISCFQDDNRPPQFFITGDKHRNYRSVAQFCKTQKTRRRDVLIILGDAGFNYYGDKRDAAIKRKASKMSITLFCIHGNKENRPANVGTYGKRNFCGGKVYYEPQYPNILFAIDSEIYNFGGREYFVMGGAHSVDKNKCLETGQPYWEDEMPTPALLKHAEARLLSKKNNVYGVLTHTCPLQYLPVEAFLSNHQNASREKRKTLKRLQKKEFEPDIDRSTEYWLDKIEQKLNYKEWFCGHYHVDKSIDKITMLFHEIRPLYLKKEL